MASATLSSFNGVFGDSVFSSTDLNRRSGEVLDKARRGPVTISRNKEQFALFRRDQAAELVRAALQFGPTLELLQSALSVVERKAPNPSFEWLRAFEVEDIRRMVGEVLVASIKALRESGDWDEVTAVIHEWHESALIAHSEILDESLKAEREEVTLTDPLSILQVEREVAAE